MKNRKALDIDGQKVVMEKRVCANHGCSREFWAVIKSEQSICGTSCWEFVNHRVWRRGEKQPKIRRPGEKSRRKKKLRRLLGKDHFRKLADDAWALRIAKEKAVAKGLLDPDSHPRALKFL